MLKTLSEAVLDEPKEAWNRLKELWLWTRKTPRDQRSEVGQSIADAYRTVLARWLVRWVGKLFLLFILTGLVAFYWHLWDRIFDWALGWMGF